jgi:hypothetical protein
VVVSARGVGLEGLSDGELLGAGGGAGGGGAPQPPLVIACDLDPPSLVAACARCRALAIPILAGATLGFHGFVFQDGGEARAFLPAAAPAAADAAPGAPPPPLAQPRTAHFRALAQVLEAHAQGAHAALARARQAQPAAHAWLALHAAAGAWAGSGAPALTAAVQRELALGLPAAAQGAGLQEACAALVAAALAGEEVSPVAAVVGAMAANEAMKVVTGKDAPLCNFLCFDGMGGTGGRVYEI